MTGIDWARLIGAAVVGIAALGSTAVRAQPVQVSLTADELSVLRVIAECRKDATPAYCAPFRPLIDHLASPGAGAVAGKDQSAGTVAAGDTKSAPRPKNVAQGHGPRPETQTGDKPPSATVAFTAATDTKTASLSLTYDLGPLSNGDPHSLTIVAQTPVGQDEDFTNVATQDGLTKASSIGLEYTRLKVGMIDRSLEVVRSSAYQSECLAVLGQFKTAAPNVKVAEYLTSTPGACHATPVLGLIDGANLEPKVKAALQARAEALAARADPIIDHVWMLTGGAKVGYEKHKFYDPLSLAKGELDRTPWEVSAAATYVFRGGAHSATLGYKFQRSYKDGGDDGVAKVVCNPVGTPNLACVDGFIGRPLREKKHLFSADYRFIAAKGPFGVPIGFNPTATYDAQSGEYGFQAPIYLVADKAKFLTGGIRYSWTSEEHESVFGIFVTSAFCVLPNFAGCTSKDEK